MTPATTPAITGVGSTATRVLLIVSGGIAAYKAPDLVRKLIAVGCEVQVVITEAAVAFATPLALATVSGRPVRRSLLDPAEEGSVGHIELADWAEVVLVAPATANLIARAAHGIADDLASTVLLATRAPVLWAPAMNTNMWRHPATRSNLATLAGRGARFVGPDRGELACGWVGEGRMLDPPVLAAALRAMVDGVGHPVLSTVPEAVSASTALAGCLAGRRVLVTAGPTRAYLDPVRFISNASTGAMGFELAAAARERGAEVTLVAGPVALATPAGVHRIDVETGAQMLAACERSLSAEPIDLVAMVAAVADFVPAEPATDKIAKREVLERFAGLRWRSEVDILARLTAAHGARTRFLGFAAQTIASEDAGEIAGELRRLGSDKLERKGCQALFANRVGAPGVGFGAATNAGLLLVAREHAAGSGGGSGDGREPEVIDAGAPRPKAELAGWMLDRLAERWWPPEAPT